MKCDITLSVIFENLILVVLIIFILYLFFYSRVVIITNLKVENRERISINLANGIISHEKLAYEDNGVIYRGILDAKKLDELLYRSDSGLKDIEEFKNVILNPNFTKGKLSRKEFDLGYNQLLTIIYVVDLSYCDENNCTVWVGELLPVNSLDDWVMDNPSFKFLSCMYQSFDGNWLRPTSTCLGFLATGAAVGSFVGGPIGAAVGAGIGCLAGFIANLYSAAEWEKCGKEALIDLKDSYVSNVITAKQGLPINIVYEDGSLHIGRIIVGVIKW
ncbi:MAG: hypothetical protein QXW01_01240 [Candidatus Aenigmatarchaeota archaeon]